MALLRWLAPDACALRTRRIECEPVSGYRNQQGSTEVGRKEGALNEVMRTICAKGLAALFLLGLAACADDRSTYTCPAATTVPDLQTIARLAPGGKDEDVQTASRIAAINSTCEKEKTGIAALLSIDFAALRTGPGIKHVEFPYFVAMADSNGNILGKEQFILGVDFPGEAATMRTTEKVTAHLPLKNPQLGNIYTIIIGFQLTKNEVDFNRAHQQ
jgi:hypothetical protein